LWRSRGSAPVDFILVALPLLLLWITTMGITLNGFARNIAQDVAIDAARYGALADQSVDEANQRAYDSIHGFLGKNFSAKVSASKSVTATSCYVEVSVSFTTIPIGFLKAASEVHEVGVATCEI
jgi:Flp pilus assembly protein TadG